MAEFDERKSRAMAALASDSTDRSRKGGIDAPITALVGRVNAHPDFFTTSSCSGRITLFSEDSPGTGKKKKKKGGDWLLVSHEQVDPQDVVSAARRFVENGENELLVFRFEPFILALDCVSVSSAQEIVACAISAGFRESGITSIKKRIMVAIRCSIRLEVPVGEKGKLHVSDEYLRYLSILANRKMEQNKQRTDRFLESFITQFQSGALSTLDAPIKVTNDEYFKVEDICSTLEAQEELSDGDGVNKDLPPSSCMRSGATWFDESTAEGAVLNSNSIKHELLQRWGHSACTINGDLVIFGGYGGSGRHSRLNDIVLFTAQDQTVKQFIKDIPPRMAQTASVVGEKIWVIGGRMGPHVLLGDVLVIDPNNLEITRPSVSGVNFTPRHRHSAAVVNKRIYVFGGLGAEGVLGDMHVLDTVNMTWSQVECTGDIPSPRYSHSLCAFGSKLYLFGGFDGKNIFGDLHMLCTQELQWSKVFTGGEAPVARFSHSCTVIGKYIAVLGGCPTMKQAKSIYMLDVEDLIWRRVDVCLPEECLLVRHTANLVGDKVYVIGGGASCYAFGTVFSTSFSIDVKEFITTS